MLLGQRVRLEDRARPIEADDVRLERNRLAEVELTFGLSTTNRFSTFDEEDGEMMYNRPPQPLCSLHSPHGCPSRPRDGRGDVGRVSRVRSMPPARPGKWAWWQEILVQKEFHQLVAAVQRLLQPPERRAVQ